MSDNNKSPIGCLSIYSVHSNALHNFVGSNIQQNNWIKFKVCRAIESSNINDDQLPSSDIIIEFDLTPHQFAELFSSMNKSEGVPCTIRYVRDVGETNQPTFSSKRQKFIDAFSESVRKANLFFDDAISTIQNSLEKPNLNKSDRAIILNKLRLARQEMLINVPFIAEQFNGQMEKTLNEVKLEAEAYINNSINSIGLEIIKHKYLSIEDF